MTETEVWLGRIEAEEFPNPKPKEIKPIQAFPKPHRRPQPKENLAWPH